jgi:hypothetical protein
MALFKGLGGARLRFFFGAALGRRGGGLGAF